MIKLRLYAILQSLFLLILIYCSVLRYNQTLLLFGDSFKIYAEDRDRSNVQSSPSSINKTRIYIFFGTRPEVIKLAPLILEFRQSETFLITTVFTGQHADIIDKYIRLFDISVDIRFPYTLERKQSINMLFGKIVLQASLIHSNKNDIWIIQGDTTSALAIATVAFHKQIRIAHVEAGLRTFNMYSPFPEEFNRKTISSIATYNFAPTSANAKCLIDEGITKSHIFITGNTVIDAAKYVEVNQLIRKPIYLKLEVVDTLVLVTIHRRENFKVSNSLYKSISLAKCKRCTFIVPVHPNPVAASSAKQICSIDRRFLCVSPLPYEELLWLLKNVKVVLTDSGGIQEEVTWFNKPTLILRSTTERKESVESGIAHLVDERQIPTKLDELLADKKFRNIVGNSFPFGDGNAAKRIVNILMTTNLSLDENIIKPGISNVSFIVNQSRVLSLAQSQDKPIYKIKPFLKNKTHLSMSVILQVYKRKSLPRQLESVVKQSLKPKSIIIVQNGYHVDVSTIIEEYRQRYREIEFQHIASSKNLRFHGRFHIAFLQKEDYVSIWDDDVYASHEWLEYCVEYSKAHNFSLVGANCRVFDRIDLKRNNIIQTQKDYFGKCDFVGHIWTLPRQYLIFYLALEPLTLYTGEDIQLAFALQKQGIFSFVPPMSGAKYAKVMHTFASDIHASWKTNQAPRTLLFCSLLLKNFYFIKCQNCNDKTVLRRCIELNNGTAKFVEGSTENEDRLDNTHFWSK